MSVIKKFITGSLCCTLLFLTGCTDEFLKPNEENLVTVDGSYVKVQSALNERSVEIFAEKINNITDTFLQESENIFYSIIPDKSYYIQDMLEEKFDYQTMQTSLQEKITDAEYIDIFDALIFTDYYKTDLHWRQETLQPVVDALGEKMGFEVNLQDFTSTSYDNYLGFYKDEQDVTPETLYYLTSENMDKMTVSGFDVSKESFIYDTEKLTSKIGYDVYLSGSTPVISVQNDYAKTDKELIIFRDSFSSSLAPLLLEEYKTITLVDLRFLSSTLMSDYVDFHGQDVLFMFVTDVINNSAMLK